MKNPIVFVDTDVVISSLISQTGAAYLLLQKTQRVDFFLSNLSEVEILETITKLKLSPEDWSKNKGHFKYVKLVRDIKTVREKYKAYTLDKDDAHVVAGAVAAKAQYLLTYNLKHYLIDKLKELNIIVFTPAQFLQYLRSQNGA